ncbi:MAG TPA: signal transduction protein [Cyanobacteria bacterium UBA11372]|nr:signal transduction protein [Cyanobacteria bacterium UBA11372]
MPRRGIRVAPACIPKIKQALRRHGFPSQNALAETLGLSRATITSFFNGRAIDYTNFVEISERLGLDWQAIAYIEEETSPPAPLLQGEGSHAPGLTSPPAPLLPGEGCNPPGLTSPPAPLLQGEGCNPPGLTSPPAPLLQGEGCNLTPTPPFPRREGGQGGLGFDWRQISQEMLKAQNQQRLTTNPLTAGDGLTFELDEIYVPLGLVERKQRERLLGDISPEEGSRIYEPETSDEITQTFQNNEFFDLVLRPGKSKRIAIIGEPGAGKTTLLQKIAAWVIDNTSNIPIWISLADLQGKTIEEYLLSNWLRSATRKVRVTPEMESALGELFNSSRVWLLLDGVDEMTLGATTGGLPLQAIAKQLTGWVADARIVLTCRLNVWDALKNALENFETYRNLDFSYGDAQTADQVGQFIRCWFKNNPALAERLRTELDKAGRERIKDTVKNPLRLALLCRTWALGKGGLPNTKAGLYQQFVEALYEWKQEQFPTSSTQRQELNQALGELAKRAIAEEKTKFRLRHRLVREILGESDAKLFKLALQLGWLNQVGVAAEAESCGEKVNAFYHPTFQEYFAAKAINDWHYFLNHNPDNPRQGTYRIFEPQWKEVILLWLGREDVSKEYKEDFIKALLEFKDGCEEFFFDGYLYRGFYEYRSNFLAAVGIAEFGDCTKADEIVKDIINWSFGYFNIEQQEWWTFFSPLEEGARATLLETDRSRAIAALVQLLNVNMDEYFSRLAVLTLGEIGTANPTAIAALVQVIKLSKNEYNRRLAAENLGQIARVNSTAIAALVQVIESNKDEYTGWRAIESLGEIGAKNTTAIAALLRIIKSTENDYTRWLAADSLGKIDSGNQPAITVLVQITKLSKNEYTRRLAAESLEKLSCENKPAIAALLRIIKWTEKEDIRRQAAESLGQIDVGNETAIATLVQLIESTQNESTRQETVVSLEKIGDGSQTAIAALVQLIESAKDKYTRRQAVSSLGAIARGNEMAIAALVQLIESNEDDSICWQAVASLGAIGKGSQTAIAALLQLIKSTQDQGILWQAIFSLGAIGTGNPTAIAALAQVIESTEDEEICMQAAHSLWAIDSNNETAITVLMQILESTKNEFICRRTAENLKKIMGEYFLARIVIALKGYLSYETSENDSKRFDACYKVIWHCAQNMSYPDFYQAWHN